MLRWPRNWRTCLPVPTMFQKQKQIKSNNRQIPCSCKFHKKEFSHLFYFAFFMFVLYSVLVIVLFLEAARQSNVCFYMSVCECAVLGMLYPYNILLLLLLYEL